MVFGLFKKKRQIEKISLSEIDSWIKKTFESKNLGLKLGILKRELNSKKAKVKDLLISLEESKIENEDIIPERARNMFYGNKASYIQKVNHFLDDLNYPDDLSLVESFLEDASSKLDDLAKDTNKNYFIIKEFAEDEIRVVANKIKELDKVIASSREFVESSSLNKFKNLKELFNSYKNSLLSVEELKKTQALIISKKKGEIDKREKVESKIIVLKKSKHFEEYSSLISQKNHLEDELKKSEYRVIDLFSAFSSALKKFSKLKKDSLAEAYSNNAVKALLDDSDFKILKTFESLLKVKDSLDLKGAKLKKLDTISSINKSSLTLFRNNLLKVNKDLDNLNSRLKNHPFVLNLKEQEGRLNVINSNIVDIELEEANLEDSLDRLNPNLIKQKMKYLIKEIDEFTELI